jgi:ubiquinone/menaquinone biosynthesis C-methylase UbiE
MKDLKKILPNCEVWGIEDHKYPIEKSEKEIKSKIIYKKYYDIPFENKYFDFVIGFSSIYKYNLEDVIKIILEINRVSKKSFFSVASYSTKKEKEIFENWTLIGSTILSKRDWKKLFRILKYEGDYYFTTSKSMRIK